MHDAGTLQHPSKETAAVSQLHAEANAARVNHCLSGVSTSSLTSHSHESAVGQMAHRRVAQCRTLVQSLTATNACRYSQSTYIRAERWLTTALHHRAHTDMTYSQVVCWWLPHQVRLHARACESVNNEFACRVSTQRSGCQQAQYSWTLLIMSQLPPCLQQ